MSGNLLSVRSRAGVTKAVAAGAATALVASLAAAFGVSAAQAAPGDGSLTINVFDDADLSATHSSTDPRLSAEVKITDSAGASVTKPVGASGELTLTGADIGLGGGAYRVEVSKPSRADQHPDAKYTDAQVKRDLADHFDPTVSFVDLAGGKDATLNVGFLDRDEFTNSSRVTVYSGVQPTMRDTPWSPTLEDGNAPYGDKVELYSAPFDLSQRLIYSPAETYTTITQKYTTDPDGQNKGPVGTVYGIGTDSQSKMIYAGAYAKRGSAYGPLVDPKDAAGAIYRIDPATGGVDVYATVADAGSTAHDFSDFTHMGGDRPHAGDDDSEFRGAVSREALGDVEISPNNKWLTTVNLHTKSLVVYPVQDALDPAPVQTLEVPALDCTADWTPFALHERFVPSEKAYVLYVGATCGATSDATILKYTRGADGTLAAAGVVGTGNLSSTADRVNRGIGGEALDNDKCATVAWRAWVDTLPDECLAEAPVVVPGGGHPQFMYPQPIVSDIQVTDDGRFILGIRDRGNDQYLTAAYMGTYDGKRRYASYIAGGDVVWAGVDAGRLSFNADATFRDSNRLPTTRSQPDGSRFGAHSQASLGALAYFNGKMVGTQMDSVGYDDNGLRQWDTENLRTEAVWVFDARNHQAPTNRLLAPESARLPVTTLFSKATGMADVDAMVREATQQIGNRIWVDQNGDGIQTAGEPSVEGVTVQLVDAQGNVVAETVTDADGEYYFHTFDGLEVSTAYEVRIPASQFAPGGALAGYTPTKVSTDASLAPVDNNGAKTDAGDVSAFITSPPKGQNDHSIDFGFTAPVSIGDYVWIDLNKDGLQDANEPALAGVTVTLMQPDGTTPVLGADGNPVTTVTRADGSYAFTGLPTLTDYTVSFPPRYTAPDGKAYDLTKQGDDTVAATRKKDSNPDPATGITPVVKTPAEGDNRGELDTADDPTIDAGYVPVLVSIGNYVWFDADSDGLQGPDEQPVKNATVKLLDKDGNPVLDADGEPRITTTDDSGYYVFTDLNPDTDYIVEFPTSVKNADDVTQVLTTQGVDQSTVDPADDSDSDSNPDPTNGRANVRTPHTGLNSSDPERVDVKTIDAGYRPTLVSIGDYTWIDENRDGKQTPGEPALPNVLVRLLDKDGNPVLGADGQPRETRTDADGYYAFGDLQPFTAYQVAFETRITTADGRTYVLTNRTVTVEPSDGETAKIDSNPEPLTGIADVVTKKDGENLTAPNRADDPTIDAGYVRLLVSIGDYVWFDKNRDGKQGADEPPAPGIVVSLLQADGVTPVTDAAGNARTATTDATGFYAFGDLDPDTVYFVHFETKAFDANGVAHVLTTHGVVQGDLADGEADVADDSNPLQDTGLAKVRTPHTGENRVVKGLVDLPTIDAGYVTNLVSIGDRVWIDVDGDQLQSAADLPVPGMVVELLDGNGDPVLDADGTPRTSTTNAQGYYWFTDLEPNTAYQVRFETEVKLDGKTYELLAPPTDLEGPNKAIDSNPAKATGVATFTTPKDGSNGAGAPDLTDDPTIDAGYSRVLVSVGDYVWIDADGDGLQGDDELPVPGATVTLTYPDGTPVLDADGQPRTAVTGDDGYYAFTGLEPSTDYVVVFPKKVLVGEHTYELTKQGAAFGTPGDSPLDSNADPATGTATVTTPARGKNSGEPKLADVPTIDAGYKPVLVSIGDFLWIDADGNGLQDADEVPVAGVEVKLLDADGNPVLDADGTPRTTKTDAEGYYAFTDLSTSTTYIVEFPTRVKIDGKTYDLVAPQTDPDAETAKIDSNPDQSTGRATVKTPVDGENSGEPTKADDPTIDAGYARVLVSIGDRVWIDANADGVQDKDEVPVSDVEVRLLDQDGKPVLDEDGVARVTKTDANGYYAFTGLEPGQRYTVAFPPKVTLLGVQYKLTTAVVGTDRAVDSNPGTDGMAPVITPERGTNSGEPERADDPTIDAGYVKILVSIGDYVWIDANGDGKQDSGEQPVPGVEVKLIAADGTTVVATTKTDANGYYAFGDLPPSTKFFVEFPTKVTVDGKQYVLTQQRQGDDRAKDSDPDVQTGRIAVTTPEDGFNSVKPNTADDPTIDAGYAPVVPVTPPLSVTGQHVPVGPALLALALLLGGLSVYGIRRYARQ